MKFLCDQMLARLGRWLRAAGYDTVIIEDSINDREVLKQALNERRYLITRDRHFLEMKDAEGILVWLEANSVEKCVKELSQKILVNWTKSPFSRCLECNEKLAEAGPEFVDQVPEDVRQEGKTVQRCSRCGKLYWMGSHTEKMLAQLKGWAR